ncbi:hypothetical protein J6590_058465 [Homalodisca vitripennis]|nr:hypothetical protein J6590_058465 [Homalodisca vitripennis]
MECCYKWPPVNQVKHPPKYEFGYDVNDGYGGSQGHLETRDGEYALGKYYVNLPSNEQKVDYFADDWGFHPLVEYKTSSGSSSMSTQFALGEKAVAALSRQYGVAPPLEILKTKVTQTLVAGTGPQVSLPGAAGFIPGPSDTPVHNSLEGESYSTTTSSPSTLQIGVFPSTQRYEYTSGVNRQRIPVRVGVSTVSPGTYTSGVLSTTENYPTDGLKTFESQKQPADGGGLKNYGTSEETVSNEGLQSFDSQKESAVDGRLQSFTFQKQTVNSEGLNNYELKKQTNYYQNGGSGSLGYGTTGSSIYQEYSSTSSPLLNYQTNSFTVPDSGEIVYNKPAQSSALSESQGNQITSYLADSNSAVDVTGREPPQRVSGLRGNAANTQISAFLVGEGGNQYEENEIRNEYNNRYVSSTTQRPLKTILRPIVVSESGESDSSLALYSGPSQHGLTSSQGQRQKKIGKLYHREGGLKSTEDYSSSSLSSLAVDLDESKENEYYSTPAPIPEPVLVTPRVEASRLTSSGNILAPIQAGVSISNHQHQEEDCDEKEVHVKSKSNLPSSGPDIEKQVLHEEAVYKTTVDIQKSIPFEIHPDENDSQSSLEQYKEGSNEQYQQNSQESNSQENQSTREEYRHNNQAISEAYHESYPNGYQSASQQSSIEEGSTNSGAYGQNTYETHSSEEYNQNPSIGNRDEQYQQHSSEYQAPGPLVPPVRVAFDGASQYNNNNFLQKVIYAYHRMANNQYKQQTDNNGYQANLALPTQPLFVPNRLYYVYLQRYNPYINRYGSQSQLYTNYRPATTVTPLINTSSDLYGYGQSQTQENNGYVVSSGERTYLQESQNGGSKSFNGNGGYASYVNHEEIRQSDAYDQSNIGALNLHNTYEESSKDHYASGVAYNAQASSSEENQRDVQGLRNSFDQAKGGAGNLAVAATPVAYGSDGYQSQNVALEFASHLNSLGNAARGLIAESAVHPDNQHVQYSTGQGESSQSLEQEGYSQNSNRDLHQEQEFHSQIPQEKFIDEIPNDVQQNQNILVKEVPVPQYVERTKLVEVEKPVHIAHPVPIEFTKVVERPVPVAHPVPVPQTQYIEKPVAVPQPVPVEVTRIVEKPVPVPHPVPVEYTKVVAVEKPVAVPHPVPYAVTKLVTVDRPVAYPQPVPLPYAVPHPVGVPVPHLVPYPHVVPLPVKNSRPIYLYRKSSGGHLLHRDNHQAKLNFRPSQPVFTSQYPPQTYHITEYLRTPHAKSRAHGRKLCIEYGGFKPPLVPSVQVDDEPKATYGPPAKERN